MFDSKVAIILKVFTKNELRSFKKFIESPFFESRRDINGYYALLRKYHPEFDISADDFFEKLFPGKSYNERKLKNLGAELVKLAKQFLVVNSVKVDSLEQEKILANEYRERNCEQLFYNTLRSLEKKIYSTPFESITCFNEEEKLERMKEDFYSARHRFKKAIPSKLTYTEQFTMSFLIRYLRNLRDRKIIALYNIPFESALLDGVLESLDFDKLLAILKESNFKYYWLLKIYYFIFKATEDGDTEKYFREMKKDIYENLNKFTHQERYFLFNDLIDYCSRQEFAGNYSYRNEEFDIYKEMMSNNAFSASQNDYLSVVLYRNTVLLACSLKEYDWLADFIETFSPKLRPEYTISMKHFALANLNFEQGNFEKTLENLSKVQYDLFLFKTDIRSLQLRSYYELDLYDQAYSLVDAFRHYLLETEDMDNVIKKRFNLFLRIYVKLLKAKENMKMKDIQQVLFDVEHNKNFISRLWLKQKATELEDKHKRS